MAPISSIWSPTSGARRLPQRALHQGADRARQHLQAGNPAARRDHARPRPRRLRRDHAAHRPHRRLHRARRRRRRLARRDPPDLRRLAAVHDLHAQLPAADGHGAAARHADAERARTAATGRIVEHRARPARRRHRHQGAVASCPIATPASRTSPIADVVVAGGLGLRSPENFQLVRAARRACSAREYGGSRPLVQKGWVTGGPADRPDRQDDPAEALYRRRHFRRDPASRRRRGRRSDRRHQHRQERADLRLRPSRHRRRCDPSCCRR